MKLLSEKWLLMDALVGSAGAPPCRAGVPRPMIFLSVLCVPTYVLFPHLAFANSVRMA